MLQLVESEDSRYSLSCKFRNFKDNFTWIFTGVYGPTSNENRELLWEDLCAIRGLWGDPRCVGGDFNVIRFLEERNRVDKISSSMRRFSQIINELELMDLPLQGGSFTWRGGLINQRMTRLDWFLVTNDWDAHFGWAT